MSIYLFQTTDNGEIEVVGGVFTERPGLETAAYLSMFGGNEDDNGIGDNPLQWWGNLGELDASRRYRSETQHLLTSLPATPNNLKRVQSAAERDLAWMLTDNVATSIAVAVSIPKLNAVNIDVTISADGEDPAQLNYLENWQASL